MAVDRPTFDESWHRVANLRPRLRSTVQVHRQSYRGQLWHVYRDPGNNRYFRLPEPIHGFVGLLDGSRTVAEAWDQCGERFGDQAPTQGEAIQALGMLYTSNLLRGELPPDARGMLERQTQRRQREVRGYLQNILFARIPLLDPEPALQRLTPVFGWIFSWVGGLLWLVLVGCGLWAIAGQTDRLLDAGSGVLAPDNLLYLYLAFAGLKLLHEFGHGVACKQMAKRERGGGEVRTLGIMLLVLMPLPYVDATSSWSFRSRWRRITVSAAGMYVEVAAAAVAAIVWARTGEGSVVHAVAYNAMFVASVTTLLFNANPLIRFDGYYILSDLLEMPNLYQRSQNYLKYLIKKFVYGVRRPQNPATLPSDPLALVTFGIASLVYRVFLFAGIFLFVFDKLFFLGAAFALWGIVGYVVVPLVKLGHYLVTSPELTRTRSRANLATASFVAALVGVLGFVPWANHDRASGVVEPRIYQKVSLGESGFIMDLQRSGRVSGRTDHADPLIKADNPELRFQRDQLAARVDELERTYAAAMAQDAAEAKMLREQVQAVRSQLELIETRLDGLVVGPPESGWWLVHQPDRLMGTYRERGEEIGVIASLDDMVATLVADQHLGPRIHRESPVGSTVELRVKDRPDTTLTGTVESILPAGHSELPSPALGYAAGGNVATKQDDSKGVEAAERFFEVRVRVHTPQRGESPARPAQAGLGGAAGSSATVSAPAEEGVPMAPEVFPGQRVVVRFELPDRPLLSQAYLALRQLLQKRFQI